MTELTQAEKDEAIQSWVSAKKSHNEWKRRALPNAMMEPVDPSPEQVEAILAQAQKTKEWRAKQRDYEAMRRMMEVEEADRLRAEWDAGRFYRLMRERARDQGVELITDGEPLRLIKLICCYFGNDPRYTEQMEMDPRKGMMIWGDPGLGKSWLIRLIADNPVLPVQIVTMAEIVESIRAKGEFNGLDFGNFRLIYIDDVGTEYNGDNHVKHFGTDVNWFKTFIEEFYAKQRGHYHRLWFSTNDTGDEIERKYGFRVRDRLREMFNLFNVYGESMRK